MTSRHARLAGVLAGTSALLVTTPALAGGFVVEEHGYYIVNFVVMLLLFWKFGRQPARDFLKNRHDAVAKEILEATALKDEAKARLDKYASQLSALEAEIQGIRDQFEKDGNAEAERILEEAKAQVAKIGEDVQITLGRESAAIREELEREVAARATALAEQKVRARMNSDTQKRLVRGFITELESKSDLSSFA